MSCSPACTLQQTCVRGVCTGIGYVSCTLTWSRPGDGDLVVVTPNNNVIYYANRGPSNLTDGGQLDVDDTTGTGPENIFWSNNGTAPPNGTYYVCFSQFSFSTTTSPTNPISATVKIAHSNSTVVTYTRNFTATYKNYTACDATSDNLLGSFNYP